MRRVRAFCAGVFCALWALTAWARPSFWQRTARPASSAVARAVERTERLLDAAAMAEPDRTLAQEIALGAVALSELEQSVFTQDPRLPFLVAEAMIQSQSRREPDVVRILSRALSQNPDSPLAARGWFNLGVALAKLGQPRAEIEAYTRAAERAWEPDLRATIFCNRGEAHMVLGELESALADYRRAVEAAHRPEIVALAYYGLGVALERSGDFPAALKALDTATAIRLPVVVFGTDNVLDLPEVFFVPEYDADYYRALSLLAVARRERDPSQKLEALRGADENFSSYLEHAVPDGRAWIINARAHRQRLARQISELEHELRR